MSELGIGDLARRTGLTPQVIRAWETRFGFPRPRRTASGRRTYDPRDVDRIARVLTLKESGSRLAQAIARVTEQGDTDGRDLSVYGELRRLLPHLASRVMRRDVLVAISRAIEDEALARAVRPAGLRRVPARGVLPGSRRRAGRSSRGPPRAAWSSATSPAAPPAGARPVRVPLGAGLAAAARVGGRRTVGGLLDRADRLGGRRDAGPAGERRFETIFSLEPEAVRVAVDTCLAAARAAGVPDEALAA